MKGYKRYVLGSTLAGFLAFVLMVPAGSAEAFWGFGKSKKENNANYTGAVVNAESKEAQLAPSITVVSPNGGETLVGENNYNIKWKSRGLSKKVQLSIFLEEVIGDAILRTVIATSTSNKGVYKWKVPTNVFGNNFKVVVNAEVVDYSDGYFSIVQKIKIGGVSVVSPNGGEKWMVGQTKEVKWKKQNIPVDSIINLEVLEEGVDREFITVIYHGLSATSTSYKWSIKNTGNIKGDKNYRVIVRAFKLVNNGYELLAEDVSNNTFYIGNL